MRIVAFSLSLALLVGTSARAQFGIRTISSVPPIPCRYGTPVQFDQGILKYPDFTVRFTTRTELMRDDHKAPWIKYVFAVLDPEHRTIGGQITFNSEERANGRRFDVQGKIYIAEMFSSTADVPESERPSLKSQLARNEIVIWDESTASRHNPRLRRVWAEEKVDPIAKYSELNAYAGGVLLPGFGPALGRGDDAQFCLAKDSLRVERVSVANDDKAPPPMGASACAYGSRVYYKGGPLSYPDFTARLISREETDAIDVRASALSYDFAVFDHTGTRTGFQFSTSNLANGYRFAAGGATYFAEMFYSTAASSDHQARGEVHIPLGPGELIIWNQAAARAANATILSAWNEKNDALSCPPASKFAAGTPLPIGMFTGDYIIGNPNSWCEYSKLDAPPIMTRKARIVYPEALAGSGFIGHVGGYLLVDPDGSIEQAQTTYGNEPMFQAPSQAAVAQLRFSPPRKNSKPVKALMKFAWDIREPNLETNEIMFE